MVEVACHSNALGLAQNEEGVMIAEDAVLIKNNHHWGALPARRVF